MGNRSDTFAGIRPIAVTALHVLYYKSGCAIKGKTERKNGMFHCYLLPPQKLI